jgi:endonuclease III
VGYLVPDEKREQAFAALREATGLQPARIAEEILLFTGTLPVLALESNALRVLLRLGYGKEDKNYDKRYRSAQQAAWPGCMHDCKWLTRAHLLLQQHGRETCKRKAPRSQTSALRADCPASGAG